MNKLILQAVAALVVVVAMWFGWRAVKNHYIEIGKAEVQAKWDADKLKLKQAEELAIADRNAENAREKERQALTEKTITEKYNAELTEVRNRLVTSERLRVGTKICGSGSSTASKANGTEGSNGTNPGTRLVSDDVERDLRAFMIRVEEGFAAGRACQMFIQEEGMAP